MAQYRIGDFVSFEPTYESMDNKTEETHYDFWVDNQIENITSKGKYIFEDFEGEWEEWIISGHSPDYKAGENGIYDIRIGNESTI